jgi:hypothetical protein
MSIRRLRPLHHIRQPDCTRYTCLDRCHPAGKRFPPQVVMNLRAVPLDGNPAVRTGMPDGSCTIAPGVMICTHSRTTSGASRPRRSMRRRSYSSLHRKENWTVQRGCSGMCLAVMLLMAGPMLSGSLSPRDPQIFDPQGFSDDFPWCRFERHAALPDGFPERTRRWTPVRRCLRN